MNNDTPLLELANLSKRYESAELTGEPPVLRDVNLEVAAGESLAVVGPSGCGKSTLLNIVGTLDQPSSGTVRLNGRDLAQLDETETARVRNREIGFIFQEHHLLPQCTVLENVLIPRLVDGKVDEAGEARARRLLDRVGLSELLDRRPGRLSGGQRQRVAVVRSLINEPALLLADEPTGSLDRGSAETLADLLIELNREEGVTLLIVTHAMDLARRMQRVFELRDGVLHPTEATSSSPTA